MEKIMTMFRVTTTPRELDTFAATVETIAAGWEGSDLVLMAETVTAEGYSIPVRLTLDAQTLRDLRHDIGVQLSEASAALVALAREQ